MDGHRLLCLRSRRTHLTKTLNQHGHVCGRMSTPEFSKVRVSISLSSFSFMQAITSARSRMRAGWQARSPAEGCHVTCHIPGVQTQHRLNNRTGSLQDATMKAIWIHVSCVWASKFTWECPFNSLSAASHTPPWKQGSGKASMSGRKKQPYPEDACCAR